MVFKVRSAQNKRRCYAEPTDSNMLLRTHSSCEAEHLYSSLHIPVFRYAKRLHDFFRENKRISLRLRTSDEHLFMLQRSLLLEHSSTQSITIRPPLQNLHHGGKFRAGWIHLQNICTLQLHLEEPVWVVTVLVHGRVWLVLQVLHTLAYANNFRSTLVVSSLICSFCKAHHA